MAAAVQTSPNLTCSSPHSLLPPCPPLPPPAAASTEKEATHSEAAGSAAKRRRVQPQDTREFVVTISNPHSFKAMCDIISNVLINTHFQLLHTPSFEGIRVDTVDPNMVCMIKTKFACNVWVREGLQNASFCLRMKTLNTLFRHISAHHMLSLSKHTGSPDLTLRIFNRFDKSSSMEFVIKTLEQPHQPVRAININSKYTVEMALAQCKTMFKMGKDIKAPYITFEIFEQGSHAYFRISAQGDEAMVRYTFQSATKETEMESGGKIYALQPQEDHPDLEQMECVFKEMFSTEFLNLFLKSMDKQSLQLTLVPRGPLIMHYHLGADQSNIRFILAPQDQ